MNKDNKKVYSDDLYLVLRSKSASYVGKYVHNSLLTTHIYLGLGDFLYENKDTPRYSSTFKMFKDVTDKYGVNKKMIEKQFLIMKPSGKQSEGVLNIETSPEVNALLKRLQTMATSSGKSMQIENLIRELMSDRSYHIHQVIEQVLIEKNRSEGKPLESASQEVDSFAKDMLDSFKIIETETADYKELNKIREVENLNEWVKNNPQTIIGMDYALDAMYLSLSKKTIPNVALVGLAGTGKSSVVYELCQRINEGNVPATLQNKQIYLLNTSKLIAGTRYRGDFEEKLVNIVDAFKKSKGAILFIDEMHTIIGLGAGGSNDGTSGDNILKDPITRGEIQVIGATTSDEYTKIEKEKAFARRFNKVLIKEPTIEETKEILRGITPVFEEYFGRKVSDGLVDEIADLSSRYGIDLANPAKAINMFDMAFANSKVFNEKSEFVLDDDALNAIKLQYGSEVSKSRSEDTKKELKRFILGQTATMDRVIENLEFVESGLVDPEKPLVSMLFGGPTG